MKKTSKVNMVANMAKAENLPSQAMDEVIYDLPQRQSPASSPPPTTVAKIPFTNQLTPNTFLRLKQFECWGGMEIQEILEEALTAFFSDKPEADRELPVRAKEKLRKKLPNL